MTRMMMTTTKTTRAPGDEADVDGQVVEARRGPVQPDGTPIELTTSRLRLWMPA